MKLMLTLTALLLAACTAPFEAPPAPDACHPPHGFASYAYVCGGANDIFRCQGAQGETSMCDQAASTERLCGCAADERCATSTVLVACEKVAPQAAGKQPGA